MVDTREQTESGKSPDKKDIRAAMEISTFIGDIGMKVLPGKEWGVHYRNPQRREDILNAVLQGHLSPEQVDIAELRPVGMSYRLNDVQGIGLNALVGRVRDRANFYRHFNYRGFLDFLDGLKGHDVDLQTATKLFDSIDGSRIQSELLRTLGATGKTQLQSSLRKEAQDALSAEDKGKMQSLLGLLKARWLAKKGIIAPSELTDFEGGIEREIKKLADELDDSYLDYVQKGDSDAKKRLAETIRKSFTEIKKQLKADELDDFVDKMMEEYEEMPPEVQQEIDNAFNDYEPPQNDTPPDFHENFSPSMDEMKEVGEKQKVEPLYSIEPPITGLYQGPIYSHFNAAQVEWEMRHNMQPVNQANAPHSHSMRGKIGPNSTLPIYLPRNYSIASIPQGFQLLKDENGTYYLRNNSESQKSYELAFGKQAFLNTNAPTRNETSDISSGSISTATKNYLSSLRGKNNVQKAQAIIHYMKNVLKLKYSNDSKFNRIYKINPSKYFSEIEKHKEVDCDVAQTYFIALCRLAGIPSRLVTGHSVDLVEEGKAIIHRGTGHAWTEIWDGESWKTIDATPENEDDEKEEGEKKKGSNAPKEDTDIKAPQKDRPKDKMSEDEVRKKVDDAVEKAQEEGGQEGESSTSIPDSAKEKMEQLKEKQAPQEPKDKSESEIKDEDWSDMEEAMQEMKNQHEEMNKKAEELKEKMKEAEKFKDLKDLEKELEEAELYDETRKQLEEMLEAKEEQAKKELKEEIEKMLEDGFITEEEAEKLLKELEVDNMDVYSKVEQKLEHESQLYNEYEGIRQEVMPLVEQWFEFFAARLPKIEEIDYDEDVQTRRGRFDRRSISKPRNLLFGNTQNPLILNRSIMPRFMASLVLDISGSMSSRMRDARKLLIFFSELFDKISEEFGYIKFSISAFDTAVEVIKDFDHEYGAPTRYNFDGNDKTVKVRLMEMTMARGGTDMGKAVWDANKKLNDAKADHPDYLSALYTISDGDTSGALAGENLRRFLHGQQEFWGEWWGDHIKGGFLLGPKSQKAILAQYFGEDDSEAVPNLEDLIEKVMERFDEDVQNFIDNLPED